MDLKIVSSVYCFFSLWCLTSIELIQTQDDVGSSGSSSAVSDRRATNIQIVPDFAHDHISIDTVNWNVSVLLFAGDFGIEKTLSRAAITLGSVTFEARHGQGFWNTSELDVENGPLTICYTSPDVRRCSSEPTEFRQATHFGSFVYLGGAMGLTINQDLFEVDLFGGFKGLKITNTSVTWNYGTIQVELNFDNLFQVLQSDGFMLKNNSTIN